MPFKDPERAREYQRDYQAGWHLSNRERRLSANYERKAQIYWYIQEIKNSWACGDCGIQHPAVLQFHHIRREEKLFSIADAVRKKISLETLRKEIAKCVVLCANCHAIRHWRERKAGMNESIAAQLEYTERALRVSKAEQEAWEHLQSLMFGDSGDAETEYETYQEYWGVNPENRGKNNH